MQVAEGTLSGPNMEDRGESVDHISMAEQLWGIGTSFEGLEIPDENDMSGWKNCEYGDTKI